MRLFGKDCERRIWLFDRLMLTMLSYGAKIWGWKERGWKEDPGEVLENVGGGVAPEYMIKEEQQTDLLRTRAGKLTWSYEKKLRERKEGELAKECWKDSERKKERERKQQGQRGMVGRETGILQVKEIERIDKEMQKNERWQKIIDSKYNKCIKEEGVPRCIKGKWSANRVRKLARYRLGNEVKEGRYWITGEERKCRLWRKRRGSICGRYMEGMGRRKEDGR